jgi:Domain of unknown function (DUF5615)
MRIKLDENLTVHLAAILTNPHHDVHTIAEENLSGRSDREVLGSGAARCAIPDYAGLGLF